MEHRVDLLPSRELASVSATKIEASGLQSAVFEQALSEHIGELESPTTALKSGTALGPSAELAKQNQNEVREDLFPPTPNRFKPVSPAPDVSVIAPDEPEALPKIMMPLQAQGLSGEDKKPDLKQHADSDGQTVKRGTKGHVYSDKLPSPAGESATSIRLPENAVPVPSLAAPTASSQTLPARLAQPGAAMTATIQTSKQPVVPTGDSNASGGNTIDQGENGTTALEAPATVSSSPNQPTGSAGTSNIQGSEGGAASSATLTGDHPLVASSPTGNPGLAKIPDNTLNSNKSAHREDASGNASSAATDREPQTTGADAEIRSVAGPHLSTAVHAPPPNAAAPLTATPQPSAEAGTNPSRLDSSLALTPIHSEHAASAVSSRLVDPYQKMDQTLGVPAPILSAGANRVTVGLHDPALGWVEIKTQSAAGQIAAALVTSSSQSHQVLAAQLPSMAQFLADREVTISSIAVEQQTTGGALVDTTGFGHQGKPNAQENGESQQSEIASHAPRPAFDSGTEAIEAIGPLSYISVIA